MTPNELQKHKQRLIELRSELRGDITRAGETIVEETHSPGEHEIAPSEGVDAEIELERSAQEALRLVSEALERVEAGTFGRCLSCGRDIDATRLVAIPYAANCIDCERARENG